MTIHATAKQAKLQPRVLDSINRLKSFIEMGAPIPIIGRELCLLFKVALSAYGSQVGIGLLDELRESDLATRGVCENDDCVAYVERPYLNICEPCKKALELDDESLQRFDKEMERENDHQG